MRKPATKWPRTPRERSIAAVLVTGALAVIAVAERDLHRRPDAQVRGDKRLWRVVCLNAVGALGYLLWGRVSGERTRSASSAHGGDTRARLEGPRASGPSPSG